MVVDQMYLQIYYTIVIMKYRTRTRCNFLYDEQQDEDGDVLQMFPNDRVCVYNSLLFFYYLSRLLSMSNSLDKILRIRENLFFFK